MSKVRRTVVHLDQELAARIENERMDREKSVNYSISLQAIVSALINERLDTIEKTKKKRGDRA